MNVPSPLPSSTETRRCALATARSSMAVAVEVPRHDRAARPDRVGDRRLEGAVAVAQQHATRAVAGVVDGQVERAHRR